MENGRIDYIINTIDDNTYVIDNKITFNGFLAVVSVKDELIVYHYTNDVTFCMVKDKVIIAKRQAVTGEVVAFTKELTDNNKIIVKLSEHICPSNLDGAFVDIKTDQIRNGFYEIESAKVLKDGLYELSVGNTTFIRSYVDDMDFAKGFIYNINEGAPLTIPLSNE